MALSVSAIHLSNGRTVKSEDGPKSMARHTVICEQCGAKVELTNGHGKYFMLNVFQIELVEGEFVAEKIVFQTLCQFCLTTLSILPKPQSVVVGREDDHKRL